MYVGIDIGGTKTLVAVLTNGGKIVESVKFPTPKKYSNFLLELAHTAHHLEHQEFIAGAVAVTGLLDRKHGRQLYMPNLPWKNEPVGPDAEKIFKCPIVIENDAKLAGLSEAMLHKEHDRVLYVTVSTGIGTALIYKQRLDEAMQSSEGGHIIMEYKGQWMSWEKFASGKAIYERYGKKASDITDEKTWREIARNIAVGLQHNIAVINPDLVVIGGSIGTYFDKYKAYLHEYLKKYEVPYIGIPKIIHAQRPEEAVVYGCYDLAKQVYGKHA